MFGWFRKPIPAQPPLADYWATVHVALRVPLSTGDGPAAVGYLQIFGLRAASDRVRELIGGCVDDGTIDWQETEIEPVDVMDVDRALTKALRKPHGEGIWHASGRMYFGDDDAGQSEA